MSLCFCGLALEHMNTPWQCSMLMIKHGKLWVVWLYGIMTVKVQVHLTKAKVQWKNEASQHHNHRDMLIGPLQWPAKRVGVERFRPQHWSNGDRFGTGLWVLLMIPDSGWLTLMLELRTVPFFRYSSSNHSLTHLFLQSFAIRQFLQRFKKFRCSG